MRQNVSQNIQSKRLVRVFIMPKKNILDPKGQALQKAFQRLGLSEGIKQVRVGKLIEISIESTPKKEHALERQMKQLCEDLLSNPITEEYEILIT